MAIGSCEVTTVGEGDFFFFSKFEKKIFKNSPRGWIHFKAYKRNAIKQSS